MKNKAKRALARAMVGANEAEIYISHTKELSIEVRHGQVETLKEASSAGMGVRVFIDHNLGFAFTSDLSEKAINLAVDKALNNAKYTQGDEFMGVALKPKDDYPVVAIDHSIERTPIEDKIALAILGESAAREYDARIDQVEACGYDDVLSREIIVNSRGIDVDNESSYCGLYVSLVARENDDVQTGFAMNFERTYKKLDPVACGEKAAKQAIRMLGADTIDTMRIPLIFDPYTATSLLGVLASSLSGENVLKGKSMLEGKLGESIMSPHVSIVDDGALADGVMSASCDAEGIPTRENILVKEGVLKKFLYNSYAAKRAGTVSTGNAVRGGFSGGVGVGTSNLYLQAGKRCEKDLIASLDDGLYVTSLLGMHTADPISGDFSIGASGLRIKDGELRSPVKGVVISGNLLTLFKDIKELANNLTYFAGTGAPSMLTDRMTVSGN